LPVGDRRYTALWSSVFTFGYREPRERSIKVQFIVPFSKPPDFLLS